MRFRVVLALFLFFDLDMIGKRSVNSCANFRETRKRHTWNVEDTEQRQYQNRATLRSRRKTSWGLVVELGRKLILPTCYSTVASDISSKNDLSFDKRQWTSPQTDAPAGQPTARQRPDHTTYAPACAISGNAPAARLTARRHPGRAVDAPA